MWRNGIFAEIGNWVCWLSLLAIDAEGEKSGLLNSPFSIIGVGVNSADPPLVAPPLAIIAFLDNGVKVCRRRWRGGEVFGHVSCENGVVASSDVGFEVGSGEDGETTVTSDDAHTQTQHVRIYIIRHPNQRSLLFFLLLRLLSFLVIFILVLVLPLLTPPPLLRLLFLRRGLSGGSCSNPLRQHLRKPRLRNRTRPRRDYTFLRRIRIQRR